MKLYDICQKIAEVEEGLRYGQIKCRYDNLMCAMKPGHPADILDSILSEIGWTVFDGDEVSDKKVESVLMGLVEFQDSFKVDLKNPIKHLKGYLAERKLAPKQPKKSLKEKSAAKTKKPMAKK